MARLNYYSILNFPCCSKFDTGIKFYIYCKILDYLDTVSVTGAFGTSYQAKKCGFFDNIIYIHSGEPFDGRFYSVHDVEYSYLKDFYSFAKHTNIVFDDHLSFFRYFNLYVLDKPSHYVDDERVMLTPPALPDLLSDLF